MQLVQTQPGLANRSLVPVESGRMSVTVVAGDTSRMLTWFSLVCFARVQLAILCRQVGCRGLVVDIEPNYHVLPYLSLQFFETVG